MSTTIRSELSKKNEYWIEKHRYYELKHFCLQYPFWKNARLSLDGFVKRPYNFSLFNSKNAISNPTERCTMVRIFFSEKIEMIERVAKKTDESLANYILKGVTEGMSYDILRVRLNIPCCKDTYYKLYRRFFWLLSEERN